MGHSIQNCINEFLKVPGGKVLPEFPTGYGKIDLIVMYGNFTYGIELKSYTNERNYKEALEQAAQYGKQLKLPEIFLVFSSSISTTKTGKNIKKTTSQKKRE
jgi:Holliday junction resolvase-like predicted endonuclease